MSKWQEYCHFLCLDILHIQDILCYNVYAFGQKRMIVWYPQYSRRKIMEQPLFTSVKVNNEIELCEITDLECKSLIEKALLAERISYYIRWAKPSIFHRNRHSCTICINDNSKEIAEEVVRAVCDEKGYQVKFLMRKSQNQYL